LVIAILNNVIVPALVFSGIFLLLFSRILEDYGRAYKAAKTVVKKQSELK